MIHLQTNLQKLRLVPLKTTKHKHRDRWTTSRTHLPQVESKNYHPIHDFKIVVVVVVFVIVLLLLLLLVVVVVVVVVVASGPVLTNNPGCQVSSNRLVSLVLQVLGWKIWTADRGSISLGGSILRNASPPSNRLFVFTCSYRFYHGKPPWTFMKSPFGIIYVLIVYQRPQVKQIPYRIPTFQASVAVDWEGFRIPICIFKRSCCIRYLGGGFKYFFIFAAIWGRFPFWLYNYIIFFRWIETTNYRYEFGTTHPVLCPHGLILTFTWTWFQHVGPGNLIWFLVYSVLPQEMVQWISWDISKMSFL